MHSFCVGAMFHNEGPYLAEWIEHYLNRNIDHIYLINDQSNDDFEIVLGKYKKYITVFNIEERLEKPGRQIYFYNKFFKPILKETEWIGIFDIDEYVWSPHFVNLKLILDQFKKQNIFYYSIPMVLFGSNNYVHQPKKIVDSFTKRVDFDKNYLLFVNKYYQYKPIVKSDQIINFNIHYHDVACTKIGQNNLSINKNLFRLNHYRLQSEDKWKEKIDKKDINLYFPLSSENISPNIKVNLNKNFLNYRNMELFYAANKIENKIKDLGLIEQNKCNGILYEPK